MCTDKNKQFLLAGLGGAGDVLRVGRRVYERGGVCMMFSSGLDKEMLDEVERNESD